jgi:two-component sensor histidine kinase
MEVTSPRVIFTVLATCLLASCGGRFQPLRELPTGPAAVKGVVDLRDWDFARDGNVMLHGEWIFYEGKLLNESQADSETSYEFRRIPDIWKGSDAGEPDGKGAGTYRVRVLLPPARRDFAVRNWTVATAFELEVNGRLMASGGRPALEAGVEVPAYNPGVTRFDTGNGEVDFLVRVSNHEYRAGGIWHAFVLGLADGLDVERKRSVYGALAIFAAISAIALNSFFIFLFRRKELPFLFFTIFSLALAVRPLVTGDYAFVDVFPRIQFGLLVRIEYATAFLAVPTAAVFFLTLFEGILKRAWVLVFTLPFLPFMVFDLIAPLDPLTRSIFYFYGVGITVLVLLVILVLGRAAYRRMQGGVVMLIGGILLSLGGINDILYSSFIIPTGNVFPISLVVFICLQAVVLARRFTRAFDKVEVLSGELALANERLHAEVKTVTETGVRLQALLKEKEMLVREVHHRVKNSLQIVSSILTLQAGKSTDPALQEITRSMRDRIRAISLAHEKLYSITSGERIDLGEYVRQLTGLTVSSFTTEAGAVDVKVEAEPMEATTGICIDVGLILTELLTNSLKHAILPRGGGIIRISLHGDKEDIVLEVVDDGPGFKPERLSSDSRSLGFGIVATLVKKWRGSVDVSEGEHPRVTCRLLNEESRANK